MHKRISSVLAIFCTLLLISGAGLAIAPAKADLNIVINEIRIDQPSTDYDEYFELAGTPGLSLDGLTYIVIGDGTNGSGVIEEVTNLTGLSIPGSGFFVVAESTFTLSTANLLTELNFENSDNVNHFLVSGFTGTLDDDLDTDDDGTLDVTPWTEVIDSVALIETGGSGDMVYSAVTVGPDGIYVPGHVYLCPDSWIIGLFDPAGGYDTPGAANPCLLENIVINEIDYDQPGTDTAEFIELKNIGNTTVNLGSMNLSLVNGNGGIIYDTIALPSVDLAAGDYFVVCANSSTVSNCDIDVSPDTNLIQNGAPDAVALVFEGGIVDTVSYEGDTIAPYTEGSGVGLEDMSTFSNKSISRCPDGIDTNSNNIDFIYADATPGAANICVSDADGDGYTVDEGDCDDNDNTIYPGAPDDNCDGIDQNCDGIADEDYIPTNTTCGIGACCNTGQLICVNGSLQDTCIPGTPGAFDIPGNDIDEDCDGEILCNPEGDWKNHGQFVSCVTKELKALFKAGFITEGNKGSIVSEAAKSDFGKKNPK